MDIAEKISALGKQSTANREAQAETDRKVQELLRKWEQEEEDTKSETTKCGPKTRAHSTGGGITYLYCSKRKGHEGDHKP